MGFMNLFGKREKEENSTANATESTVDAAEGATTPTEEQAAVNHALMTAKLMKDALIEIGCQPVEKDGNTLEVGYQGELFVIEFSNNFARIWDPGWTHIKADDPNWPILRVALNHANHDFGYATVVYTNPNEDGIIVLHSHFDLLLLPMIPQLPLYVKSVLNIFFFTQKRVTDYFHHVRQQQQEESKKRRPVGFDTNTTEEGA